MIFLGKVVLLFLGKTTAVFFLLKYVLRYYFVLFSERFDSLIFLFCLVMIFIYLFYYLYISCTHPQLDTDLFLVSGQDIMYVRFI